MASYTDSLETLENFVEYDKIRRLSMPAKWQGAHFYAVNGAAANLLVKLGVSRAESKEIPDDLTFDLGTTANLFKLHPEDASEIAERLRIAHPLNPQEAIQEPQPEPEVEPQSKYSSPVTEVQALLQAFIRSGELKLVPSPSDPKIIERLAVTKQAGDFLKSLGIAPTQLADAGSYALGANDRFFYASSLQNYLKSFALSDKNWRMGDIVVHAQRVSPKKETYPAPQESYDELVQHFNALVGYGHIRGVTSHNRLNLVDFLIADAYGKAFFDTLQLHHQTMVDDPRLKNHSCAQQVQKHTCIQSANELANYFNQIRPDYARHVLHVTRENSLQINKFHEMIVGYRNAAVEADMSPPTTNLAPVLDGKLTVPEAAKGLDPDNTDASTLHKALGALSGYAFPNVREPEKYFILESQNIHASMVRDKNGVEPTVLIHWPYTIKNIEKLIAWFDGAVAKHNADSIEYHPEKLAIALNKLAQDSAALSQDSARKPLLDALTRIQKEAPAKSLRQAG